MQGIDISSNQTGINLAVVPCDFVIVKITQGNYYVNPDATRAVNQALNAGKATGVYLYVGGGGAINEADFFVTRILPWLGKVTIWVDWESGQNPNWGNTGYLDQVVKRIKQRTGYAHIGIYASSGSFPRAVAAVNGSPTWVAQYASMAPTGYQGTPWGEGNYQADIRQYASTGRLNGWGGNLDINKLYGTRSTWDSWIGEGDDMTSAADVWQFNNAAVPFYGGNAYNALRGVHDKEDRIIEMLGELPGKTWEYSYKDSATGGNMYNSVATLHAKLDQAAKDNAAQSATITALQTAIETLSKSMGANPDDIAKAVSDAVTKKIDGINITMNAKEN